MVLLQNGVSWSDIKLMDALERECIVRSFAIINGCKNNWDTGEVTKPKQG